MCIIKLHRCIWLHVLLYESSVFYFILQALFKLFENIETKYKEWKPILEAIFGTEDWFNEVLNYEPLFITKTIEELSFGYEDPIYKLVHELDPSLLPNANFSLQVSVSICAHMHVLCLFI